MRLSFSLDGRPGWLHACAADDTEAILDNFFNAILDESVPLISHAPEGIRGVELANAMVLAGLTNTTVKLPMVRACVRACVH
eukprot:SAG22_NODE_1684_length_3811_cov_1.797414_3_plen_82_part_00